MSASCCYRFSVYDLDELVLLDGHLIRNEPAVSYILWTYDYDVDTRTYTIDGYVEFKYELTPAEVTAMPAFEKIAPAFCLSMATPNDIEYYNMIHFSMKGGWTTAGLHSVTPELTTDEVLPEETIQCAPQLSRSDGCHDLAEDFRMAFSDD